MTFLKLKKEDHQINEPIYLRIQLLIVESCTEVALCDTVPFYRYVKKRCDLLEIRAFPSLKCSPSEGTDVTFLLPHGLITVVNVNKKKT